MNIAARIRARRTQLSNRRAIRNAIDSANSPTVRSELVAMAQHHQSYLR